MGAVPLPRPETLLAPAEWQAQRAAHDQRADALTAGRRERRRRGEKHPVEDFLFTYYPFSPSRMRRWSPGWRLACVVADRPAGSGTERPGRPAAVEIEARDADAVPAWHVTEVIDGVAVWRADVERYVAERADALAFMTTLLRRTADRPATFGCFGLHEWAMVHRQREHRHELPLRLGQVGTDEVVEASNLMCTHIDAFRFFTPTAVPRNAHAPTRDRQPEMDDPGCLHVGMDLYKWASKLLPLVPADLVLDCFELARDIRVLDMEASPYDCRSLGYGVVPIETRQGRIEYVRRQRGFSERAHVLRQRILAEIEPIAAAAGADQRTGVRTRSA